MSVISCANLTPGRVLRLSRATYLCLVLRCPSISTFTFNTSLSISTSNTTASTSTASSCSSIASTYSPSLTLATMLGLMAALHVYRTAFLRRSVSSPCLLSFCIDFKIFFNLLNHETQNDTKHLT